MKKSITLLVVAVMAITNAVSAANLDSAVVRTQKNVNFPVTKFVNYADASLIESELGSLKKAERSAAEKINSDLQVTEAVIPQAIELPAKKDHCQALNLTNSIRN